MVEKKTIQIRELRDKGDLAGLVPGNVVNFGIHKEPALVHAYKNLKEGELFLLSRFEYTGNVGGGIWVIYDHRDNMSVRRGGLDINPFRKEIVFLSDLDIERLLKQGKTYEEIAVMQYGKLEKRLDGLFCYGTNLVLEQAENKGDAEYVNPKKHAEFETVLAGAGM